MPHAPHQTEQSVPQLEQLFDYDSLGEMAVPGASAELNAMSVVEGMATAPQVIVEALLDGDTETTTEQEERIADVMEKRGCGRKMAELAVLGRPKSTLSDDANRRRIGKRRIYGRNNDGSIDRRTLSPRTQARADHPGDWAER